MSTKVVDSKGRITLGGRFAGRTVILDDSDPDKIVITPAVVVPEREAWLYKNRKALKSVRKGLAEARDRQFASEAPNLDDQAAFVAEIDD